MKLATCIALMSLPLIFAVGCQTGPKVTLPTGIMAPTSAASVELLQTAPSEYVDLGVVEVTENVQYGKGFTADAMVDVLKQKAAAKGATAVLLEPIAGQSTMSVGAFYKEKFYHFPFRSHEPKAVFGRAIYVEKK